MKGILSSGCLTERGRKNPKGIENKPKESYGTRCTPRHVRNGRDHDFEQFGSSYNVHSLVICGSYNGQQGLSDSCLRLAVMLILMLNLSSLLLLCLVVASVFSYADDRFAQAASETVKMY